MCVRCVSAGNDDLQKYPLELGLEMQTLMMMPIAAVN